MKKMNILAIGAHPDDIEFGCGGSLIKYARQGHRLYLLIMTRGAMGGNAEIRTHEQEVSCKILRAEKIFWGSYEDTHLIVTKKVIDDIEQVIKNVNPDFIFCHYFDDTHQDHRHLAEATISATRYVHNVLFYEGPTTQNFNPQVYVDISGVLDEKMDALKAHRSQITKTNIKNVSIVEMAHSCANFRGIQGRVNFAEAFQALRLFINVHDPSDSPNPNPNNGFSR